MSLLLYKHYAVVAEWLNIQVMKREGLGSVLNDCWEFFSAKVTPLVLGKMS